MRYSKRAGRGFNLNYKKGFKIEKEAFKQHSALIMELLGATSIRDNSRTKLDKTCGIDAYVTIEGQEIPISLRYRKSDFNSFTMSRHISDNASEMVKWLKVKLVGGDDYPRYHIQISKMQDGTFKAVVINVEAFRDYLINLRDTDRLGFYYNFTLKAYEFKLTDKFLDANEGSIDVVLA